MGHCLAPADRAAGGRHSARPRYARPSPRLTARPQPVAPAQAAAPCCAGQVVWSGLPVPVPWESPPLSLMTGNTRNPRQSQQKMPHLSQRFVSVANYFDPGKQPAWAGRARICSSVPSRSHGSAWVASACGLCLPEEDGGGSSCRRTTSRAAKRGPVAANGSGNAGSETSNGSCA